MYLWGHNYQGPGQLACCYKPASQQDCRSCWGHNGYLSHTSVVDICYLHVTKIKNKKNSNSNCKSCSLSKPNVSLHISLFISQLHVTGGLSGWPSMKWLVRTGELRLPLDGMLVHCRNPSQAFLSGSCCPLLFFYPPDFIPWSVTIILL